MDTVNPDQVTCTYSPVNVNDGNLCTTDGCTPEEGIEHIPVFCDDENACTIDSCNPEVGCIFEPIVCIPPDECHTVMCVEGKCVLEPVPLDDHDSCTMDSCDPHLGPIHKQIPECRPCSQDVHCEDNNVCTEEYCSEEQICIYHTEPCADITDSLCKREVCHPTFGCMAVPILCDAPYYNLTQIYGQGHMGNVNNIVNNIRFCNQTFCDEETGDCLSEQIDCSTEDKCLNSFCDISTNRCMHNNIQCAPSDECMTAYCDSAIGCVERPILLTPPNACQTVHCEPGTGIVYTDRDCTDDDPCTIDSCSSTAGCIHTPMNCQGQSGVCGVNDRCEDGECVSDPVVCTQPQNPCLVSTCDPFGEGCVVDDKFCPPVPDLRYVSTCDPNNGDCVSVLKDCDDQDPCTDDHVRPNGDCRHNLIAGCCRANIDCPLANECVSFSCDLDSHTCLASAAFGCCETDEDCFDDLDCTTDVCQVSTGQCLNHRIECIAANKCEESRCLEAPGAHPAFCVTFPKSCNDDDLCTDDRCDPSSGECVNEQVVFCSDGNACTGDICNDETGICEHYDQRCDDSNPCTVDSCNALTGACIFAPIDLDDQNACTQDRCVPAGLEEYVEIHTPIVCNDGDPCTEDTCNSVTGCKYTPLDFSNMTGGDVCNEAICVNGEPQIRRIPNCCHTDIECRQHGGVCTQAYCDFNINRCHFTPKPDCCTLDLDCTDHNKCTEDICNVETGECTNLLPLPADLCHEVHCDPTRGATNDPKDCSDGNACTIDSCDIDTGKCIHEDVVCTQPVDPCLPRKHCSAGECVFEEKTPCDDGNKCTIDKCTRADCEDDCSEIQCAHEACDCNDHDVCTIDSCDPLTGACTHVRMPRCECCNANSDCGDHDPCTDDTCDLETHLCISTPREMCCFTNEDCQDDNLCTTNERCDVHTHRCKFDTPRCDDRNKCTADACNPLNGLCEHRSNATMCEDNNPCTVDSCDSELGCRHTPVQCSPVGDLCSKSTCSPISGCVVVPKDCDDENVCTNDSCDSETGRCLHEERSCDDGNACTSDSCSDLIGGCVHRPIQCGVNDTSQCNVWKCDQTTGCHSRRLVCHNSDSCLLGECHDELGCVFVAKNCDDGDDCTVDSCNGGACHHERDPNCCNHHADCRDDDLCTIDTCVYNRCHHAPSRHCDSSEEKSSSSWSSSSSSSSSDSDSDSESWSASTGDSDEDSWKGGHWDHEEKREILEDEEDTGFCGDGTVDADEECDGVGSVGVFQWCTEGCKLTINTVTVALVVVCGIVLLCLLGCFLWCVCRPGARVKSRPRKPQSAYFRDR